MQIIRKQIKRELKHTNNLFIEEIVSAILNKKSKRAYKTNLLNKDTGSFAIVVNKMKQGKLRKIFEFIDVQGLTVYGDGSNKAGKFTRDPNFGIEVGDTIVFGDSVEYDVELATASRALRNAKIRNMRPAYELSNEFDEILDAIEQFGEIKRKLLKKYPQNRHSRTLYEMMHFEGNVNKTAKTKKRTTAKVNVTVGSQWLRIGNRFVSKNAADTVVIHDNNFVTTVPGCYSSRHLVY